MIRRFIPRPVKDVILRQFHPLSSIAVEPTNRCNEDCSYCHRKMRPLGDMSIPLYLKIINQIPKGTLLALSYGGESIVHPEFPKMLRQAILKGFKPIVFSNGKAPYPPGIEVITYPKPPPIIFTPDARFEDPRVAEKLKPTTDFCRDLFRYMGILWNGDVVPCCYCVSGKRVIGNVNEDGLNDVWEGGAYAELRRVGHCPGCEVYKYDLRVDRP